MYPAWECDLLFSTNFLRTHLNSLECRSLKSSILVSGPSGSGKSLLIKHIWNASKEPRRVFVQANSASIKNASELRTLYRKAKGGDLFLKGIHELAFPILETLQSLINEKKCRILGTLSDQFLDCDAGTLFEHSIHIPPLKERKEDLSYMVTKLLMKKAAMSCSHGAMVCLQNHEWREEYMELRDCVLKCIWFAKMENRFCIDAKDVAKSFSCKEVDYWHYESMGSSALEVSLERKGLKPFLSELEAIIIAKGLRATEGNISELARYLQLPISTLVSRVKVLKNEIKIMSEILEFK